MNKIDVPKPVAYIFKAERPGRAPLVDTSVRVCLDPKAEARKFEEEFRRKHEIPTNVQVYVTYEKGKMEQ